ncbi:MAG: hypothetical protein RL557_761 [archaeon]|jgi:prefoldin beta subunit
MEFDDQTQERIKELHMFEQNVNNLLMQKQAFQIELTETENALTEISKTEDEVFKVVGNIMVKSDKKKIEEDLKKRKDIILLRIKSIETQEAHYKKQADELKKAVLKKLK